MITAAILGLFIADMGQAFFKAAKPTIAVLKTCGLGVYQNVILVVSPPLRADKCLRSARFVLQEIYVINVNLMQYKLCNFHLDFIKK